MDRLGTGIASIQERPLAVGRMVERPLGSTQNRHADDIAMAGNEAARPLRLLLVDDHQMTLEGLRSVLESQHGWHVCGEAKTGLEAVEKAGRLKPDIVVMDISMPELNGLEATRRIRKLLPATEVLIFTMHESRTLVQEALAAGARGFVMKTEVNRQLIAIVKNLANHEISYSPKTSAIMMDPDRPNGSAGALEEKDDAALTPRECEVIRLIAGGQTCKEVASTLNISAKTADVHRTNILHKLKLRNAAELVRYAVHARLVEP